MSDIAIYIVGQPRMVNLCIPHYKKIFEPLKPHYFIHHWDTTEGKYVGIQKNNQVVNKKIIEDIYKDTLKESIKFFQITKPEKIEKFKIAANILGDIFNVPGKLLDTEMLHHCATYISQHYSGEICNIAQRKYKKYKWIIRLRSDLIFKNYWEQNIDILKLYNTFIKGIKNIIEPTIWSRNIAYSRGSIKSCDLSFMGNQDGMNFILNNVSTTWLSNILQSMLGDITGYSSNQVLPHIDQHYSMMCNTTLRAPGLHNSYLTAINYDQEFLNTFREVCIARSTVIKSDSFDDISSKNRDYLDNIDILKKSKDEKFKQIASLTKL